MVVAQVDLQKVFGKILHAETAQVIFGKVESLQVDHLFPVDLDYFVVLQYELLEGHHILQNRYILYMVVT